MSLSQKHSEAESWRMQDGRTLGRDGEPDTFTPRDYLRKLVFFLFCLGMLGVGVWDIAAPLSRLLTGQTEEARVVRVVVESPGSEPEILRVRREIDEGDYSFNTQFRHFVEVLDQEGNAEVYEMAVASRQTPYALVNERFEVILFPGDTYVYGKWHHRTWAFGCTFLMFGLTLVPLSGYLLLMVGKPVVIDPESEESIEQERKILERAQEPEKEDAEQSEKALT